MKEFKHAFSKQLIKRNHPVINSKAILSNKSELAKFKFNKNHKDAIYL